MNKRVIIIYCMSFLLLAFGTIGCGDEELLAQRAWECLLEKTQGDPSYEDLITVMHCYGNPSRRVEKEADKKLLQKLRGGNDVATAGALRMIIECSVSHSELRKTAGKALLKHPECGVPDATFVWKKVPELRKDAEAKWKSLPGTEELAELVRYNKYGAGSGF